MNDQSNHTLRRNQLVRLERAIDLLADHCFNIQDGINTAFEDLRSWRNASPHLWNTLKPRTKSSMLNDLVQSQMELLFDPTNDDGGAGNLSKVQVRKELGFLTVLIGSDLALRFKKVDEEGKPCNIATHQQKVISNQDMGLLPIFQGGPPCETFATVGYLVNSEWSEILDIVVVCHYRGEKIWQTSLLEADNVEGLLWSALHDEEEAPMVQVKGAKEQSSGQS